MADFIALEQQIKEAAAPTTQPAATAQTAREMINRQLGPYEVGQGDVLLVAMSILDAKASAPQIQVRVDRKGEIRLPTVGTIKVSGMPLEDVEGTIRQAYTPSVYRDLAVHVTVLAPETTKVLVRGAVIQPGLVPLRRTERNLLMAMVAAGGVTEVASGVVSLRRLQHPGEETRLNLLDPENLKAALALDPLEDGDSVTVEAANPNTVFVGGLVNAPRPQLYPWGVKMNVLQTLAAAGGLRTDVTPKEATLIRRMPDGRDVQVKLDLDGLTAGKEPNITLAAGDILWVPHTFETRVQDWINRNVFFRAGVTTTANISYDARALEFMNRNAELQGLRGVNNTGTLQDMFDPFGFLLQNQALQQLPQQIATQP